MRIIVTMTWCNAKVSKNALIRKRLRMFFK